MRAAHARPSPSTPHQDPNILVVIVKCRVLQCGHLLVLCQGTGVPVHIYVYRTLSHFSVNLKYQNYISLIFMHCSSVAVHRNRLYMEPSGELQSIAEKCTQYVFRTALLSTQGHCSSVNRTHRKQLFSIALDLCFFQRRKTQNSAQV